MRGGARPPPRPARAERGMLLLLLLLLACCVLVLRAAGATAQGGSAGAPAGRSKNALPRGADGASGGGGGRPPLRDWRKTHAAYWLKVAAKRLQDSPTANTAACSADYGADYVRRWARLAGQYCGNASSADSGGGGGSSVTCHAHPEADMSACVARGLQLSSSAAFMGTRGSGVDGLPNPQPGSVRLACERAADPASFLRGRLQSNEGSRMWLVQAPAFAAAGAGGACDPARTVQHPVLVLMRVDPENAFHNLEHVLSVFSALAVLDHPQRELAGGVEVVVADDRLPGHFLDVWRRLSHPHPLRVLREAPLPDGACLSALLLSPYVAHAQSLLTYKAGSAVEVLCESLVAHAASLWLRHLFRDLLPHWPAVAAGRGAGAGADDAAEAADTAAAAAAGGASASAWPRGSRHGRAASLAADLAPLQPTPAQSPQPLQVLHVTWLSRSRFERQRGAALTDWQQARQLDPQAEEAVVLELQRTVVRWNAQACVPGQREGCQERGVLFTLQVAELSELPFYPDQVALLMRTGVLLGVHGAGLANQVWMPPRLGAVVEVWHHMEGNFHYHNLAHMLGHAYFNVHAPDEQPLNASAVGEAARAAMDAAAAARAAAGGTAGRPWWQRAWARGGARRRRRGRRRQ